MKVYYNSADNNQVQAVFSHGTNSTVWDAFDQIEVTDPAIRAQIEAEGTDCQLTIVSGVVTAVTANAPQASLRTHLRERVANEYDQWVDGGIPVVVAWSPEPLVILPKDVELLTGALSIASSKLARDLITDLAEVLALYKFGDGVIKSQIIAKDLEELNAAYQDTRMARYIAHSTVKGSIEAGVTPTIADYTACNLILADFDGLGLT